MLLVEAVQRVGQRRGEQPAGLEVLQRAAQERRAPIRPSEQLQGLHRHEHEREPAAQGELARIGDDGLDRQPCGAVLQRSQQRRVSVQRDYRRTTGGEIERDATGAGADVENRAPGLAGQCPPQRQILAVGAALQVVPQRLEVHPRPGSSTVTASPPASRGVRVRVPSCAWVMLLTIARPRPTPACSVRIRWVPR